MPNAKKLLLLKGAQLFSILLGSDDESPLSTRLSHLHQYLAVAYVNIRQVYKKRKFVILCFLKVSNINQVFCQDVKSISRSNVRMNKIKTIGRDFT